MRITGTSEDLKGPQATALQLRPSLRLCMPLAAVIIDWIPRALAELVSAASATMPWGRLR